MKFYRFLFLAVLAMSASAYAQQKKLVVYEQFDNLRIVAFLNIEDINNSPEWNPNLGVAPLSISDAVLAINRFNKGSNEQGKIDEIELRPIPSNEKHWHYLIKIANEAKTTKYDIYVVLMDGKIIPAIIEPKGYK